MSQEGYREFEVLYMAEYPRVVRTAYLITGDRYEAADLAQEAFALAYRRWDEVSQMERAGGWLQRMVANLSLAWRRRQRQRLRARMVAPSASAQPLAGPDPDLLAALRSLPPAQRVVLVLRFFADQSIDEVARGLKKRPGTVRALTAQGINRLRRQLKEETFYDA